MRFTQASACDDSNLAITMISDGLALTLARRICVTHRGRQLTAGILLLAAISCCTIASAFPKGGGSNLLMSPGYQRALKESRQKYAEPQSYATAPVVRLKTKPRHRRH